MEYDVAVIGGGPGGYVAAIRAAQLGAKTVLIEEGDLGGTCLNRGCVPTKALLDSAAKWRDLKNCAEFGLSAGGISYDFSAVMRRKQKVVNQLRAGIASLVKSNGIQLLKGRARLAGDKKIKISTATGLEEVTAANIIIATGSKPAKPPIPGSELPGVVDSDGLLHMEKMPASVVIVGGGVVGLEFAVFLQSFGCQVTVVELLSSILPGVDRDIVNRLGASLKKQGIKLLISAKVKEFRPNGSGVEILLEDAREEQVLAAEKVLMATGRIPVLEDLGLAEAGVTFGKKGIEVDRRMQTNISGIYAVGDVTGRLQLAHAASGAGMVAAENACGKEAVMDFDNIPACIFTAPEVACVGLTEQQAVEAGLPVAVSRMNFAGNCKAVSLGETEGFVKMVVHKDNGVVLGLHIMGPHASDLIMEGTVAVVHKLTAGELAHTIHPHPTLSEAVMECAHGVFGNPIHQVKIGKR